MKFDLTIDLDGGLDQDDVAKALRDVADRLSRFASRPWSPYALSGTVYARGLTSGKKEIVGSWEVKLPELRLAIFDALEQKDVK